MKKYNAPELNTVVLLSADCITLSGIFGSLASGSGDEWDWGEAVSKDDGLS